MKTTLKTILLFALAATFASAQMITLSSTTLGAAVSTANTTSIALAATTSMQNQGPGNQINTALYVDRELMLVTAVVDSTHVTVQRGQQSTRAVYHASGAKVYYAYTQLNTPALSQFNLEQDTAEVYGSCTAATEKVLPRIYVKSGDIFQCYSSGQWFQISKGTMNTAGSSISAFCTGQLSSATTDYIGNTVCATTSAAVKQVITTAGVLANLYVIAGTAVSGGTGYDVVTVLKNGSATTLTCTFATGGAATTCSDTTHSVSVVPGDYLTFTMTTATSDTGYNVSLRLGIY